MCVRTKPLPPKTLYPPCCAMTLAPALLLASPSLQTPLIMTAIQTNSKSIYIGPGIWMSCMGVVTMVSCLLLLKWFPATNK